MQLLVLSALLLVPAARAHYVTASSVKGQMVADLTGACLEGVEEHVTSKITAELHQLHANVAQLNTLQQQRLSQIWQQQSALQQQLTAIQQRLPPALPTGEACPPNWVQYDNSCYFTAPTKATWLEAQVACPTFHRRALLASIHEANSDYITQLLQNSSFSHAWVGMFRLDNKGSWAWTDGSPVDYFNWKNGEPNNRGSGERCASVSRGDRGKWNDDTCSEKSGFICQIHLDWSVPSATEHI